MRLQGKVILITASTRGIGLAIVKKCVEEGALVYMAARDMVIWRGKRIAAKTGFLTAVGQTFTAKFNESCIAA